MNTTWTFKVKIERDPEPRSKSKESKSKNHDSRATTSFSKTDRRVEHGKEKKEENYKKRKSDTSSYGSKNNLTNLYFTISHGNERYKL